MHLTVYSHSYSVDVRSLVEFDFMNTLFFQVHHPFAYLRMHVYWRMG